MSRIGKLPVNLPEGVSATLEGTKVIVTGPKGSLSLKIRRDVGVVVENSQILVSTKKQTILAHALHGTIRSILSNMVTGVSTGWNKQLELVGTGYRVETTGKELILTVGFSHQVKIQAPDEVTFKVEKNVITVEGIDKEVVGQVTAKIRAVRPPEPYKGKGILYLGEKVRRKAGKAAKAAGAA